MLSFDVVLQKRKHDGKPVRQNTKYSSSNAKKVVDPKRSIAAKKGAVTRALNRELAAKKQVSLHHKLIGGGLIAAVVVFTVIGISNILNTYAATQGQSSSVFVGLANKCLDNYRNQLSNKNKIELYKCNNSSAQKWVVNSDNSIKSASGNYCLDIPGASKKEYVYVQLYTCNGTAAQKWSTKNGSLVNTNTGLCATVLYADSADETGIWMRKCTTPVSSEQKWVMKTQGLIIKTPTTPTTGTGNVNPAPTPVKPSPSSSQYGRYGRPLDVNTAALPNNALKTINASSASDRNLLSKITSNPMATWITDNQYVTLKAQNVVKAANSHTAVPQLVMYNIPRRDCGNYSAGGAANAGEYQTYVNQFVAGLGTTKAIVIVEPDGLPLMSCLSSAEAATRYSLIKYAVNKLTAQGSWAYIDAGTDVYQPLDVMTTRLQQAGVANATGFAMNISMFRPNDKLIAYGTSLSKNVGGKHFVIDSSRNGLATSPTDYSWCNPTPRGLGKKPTTSTGTTLLDAYLWIKTPGGSDGSCDGAPGAGEWYQSYALMLSKNAVF